MRFFESVRVLTGPNLWSRQPVLEIRLHCQRSRDGAGDELENMDQRVRLWLESAELPGDSLRDSCHRLHGARNSGELLGILILELQRWAGFTVRFLAVEGGEVSPQSLVVVEFAEESVGRLAVDLAGGILWPGTASPVNYSECRRQLQDCATRTGMGTTTRALVGAARSRGIPVQRLDGDALLQLGYGIRQRRIQGVVTDATGFLAESISRDKLLTRKLLQQTGIPTPATMLVTSPEEAWMAAQAIGCPVVVKPRDADYGNGVSVQLHTNAQVRSAWEFARRYSAEVLVERHLSGVPHRLFIVRDVLVAAARRDPAHVIGDGIQSVRELIGQANGDPRRGDGPDYPWWKIEIDDSLQEVVTQQGLTLDAVPPPGLFITLQLNPQNCYAEMIRDVTDEVHPETVQQACDAVRMVGLDVAGVDIMAADISQPLPGQGGGLLEVNAGPAIYLHTAPACQPPRPVAEAVVSALFPPGDAGLIPIITVVGETAGVTVARQIGELLRRTGRCVGVSAAEGASIAGRRVSLEDESTRARCQALLRHPRVEMAVCQLTIDQLCEVGLPFEQTQAVVMTDFPGALGESLSDHRRQQCLRMLRGILCPGGWFVVDAELARQMPHLCPGDPDLCLVATTAGQATVREHLQQGGLCAIVSGDDLKFLGRGSRFPQPQSGSIPWSGASRDTVESLSRVAAWLVAGGQPSGAATPGRRRTLSAVGSASPLRGR